MTMDNMEIPAIRNPATCALNFAEMIKESLLVLDSDLRVIFANPAFHDTFHISESATKGCSIYELCEGRWNIPELMKAIGSTAGDISDFSNLHVENTFPRIGRRILRINGRRTGQETKQEMILLVIEDATEGGKAREKNSDSEIEYQRLVETINSIIIAVDSAGKISFFNRFSEELFGYSREEALGQPFIGTIIPEKGPGGEDNSSLITDILEDPERYYINKTLGLTREGKEVWFSWSARKRSDKQGGVVEILIDGNDITREHEQRERADTAFRIINNSPDIVVRLDEDKRYVFANPRLGELTDMSTDDFMGRKIGKTLLPAGPAQHLEKILDEVARSRTAQTFETSYKDRWYMITVSPEFDSRKACLFFDVYSRDITRRKEMENELRREQEKLRTSDQRFRSVLENSFDAAYRRNLRTDTYDYISPAIEHITGLSADEFSSLSMEEVRGRIHPEDIERIDSDLENIMKNSDSGILEYRFRTKNNRYVWLGDNFSIIRDDVTNDPLRVGIVRDISDAKKMEVELRRAWSTAEKKVREAEEKQRIIEAVFDNVPEGFVIFNTENGRVEVVSRHLAEFAGLERSDFRDMTIGEYAKLLEVSGTNGRRIPLEYMPIWRTMYKGELVINETYRLRNSKGTVITVLINTAPVRDAEGRIIRGIASWRNVEPMKQAEKKLRASRDSAQKAMRKAEERERILKAILVNIPEGLSIVEAPDCKLRLVSTYYENSLGIPADRLLNMSFEERLDLIGDFRRFGEEEPAMKEDHPIYRAVKGEVVVDEEWVLKKMDGNTMVISAIAAPVRDDQGKITHAVMSWRDITESKKMEAELRRNEYELRTLVESSPDLILRFDERMRYVFVNSTYEHLTGIERERMIGRTNKELGMSEDKSGAWEADLGNVFHSGHEKNIEFSFWGLFGKRYFWGRLIPEFDRNGRVDTVMMVARDITERKQAEEHIRYVSFHDTVTGLYNRAYFEEEVTRLDTDRLLPVSFIMGDVNNLKLTNDTFGHHEGDRMLQEIAGILREACRDEDIIARWGGDEFAVILPDTHVETARHICSRIKETARKRGQTIIQPSIALGAAAKTHSEQNIYRVIMEAEARMYDNKLEESRENQKIVISSLMAGISRKLPQAERHAGRTLALAQTFGRKLGLSDRQMENIELIIRLHDIGKIIIPEDLLRKPGRLTSKEWELVKRHPEAGFRILKTFDETAGISAEILAQREHWDGGGYPRGLKGAEIPYLARVISILDVYDVITHKRPYERTFTGREAITVLRRNAGRQFDPDLVEPFIDTVSAS